MKQETVISARRREVGDQRRSRTRNKLLVAAARVLAERSENKATIDDFIQAAKVARGTFYNYYKTKDELLDDLWLDVGREPFQAILQVCTDLRDPAERIGIVARLVLVYAQTHVAWGWVVYGLSIDGDTVNRDLMSFPRPDLMIGRSVGRFTFDDLDSASDLVVGTMRQAISALLTEKRGGAYINDVCYMLLRGIGVSEVDARAIMRKPLPLLERKKTAVAHKPRTKLVNAEEESI